MEEEAEGVVIKKAEVAAEVAEAALFVDEGKDRKAVDRVGGEGWSEVSTMVMEGVCFRLFFRAASMWEWVGGVR